jgi:DNA-binding transcriptional LysR family regulator
MAGDLVDLALMEPAPDHADFLVQKWLDDELLLVCVPGHTLWDTDLLPVAELSRLHYVLREPKTVIRILVDKALQDIGIPHIQVAMELNSTKTIMAMLDQGKHVHFLPRFAAAEALAKQRLFHIKIEGLRIKRNLWIARSRTQLNNPVAESFIRLLRGE